jgi:hypothetical protein
MHYYIKLHFLLKKISYLLAVCKMSMSNIENYAYEALKIYYLNISNLI